MSRQVPTIRVQGPSGSQPPEMHEESEPLEIQPERLIRGKDYKNLRELLMICASYHTETKKKCWPDELLRRIMTKERVKEELETMNEDLATVFFRNGRGCANLFQTRTIEWYMDRILREPSTDVNIRNGSQNALLADYVINSRASSSTAGKKYLKIFTIMVICGKCECLEAFLEEEICDQDLPLHFDPITGQSTNCTPEKARCFEIWRTEATDFFDKTQYELLVPYFSLLHPPNERQPTIRHAKYPKEVIIPWKEIKNKGGEGGFGLIKCIRVRPGSHGFAGVDQVQAAKGKFALKCMKFESIKNFENESKMLRLFNHHDHIVKLLMTFSIDDKNHLLFPWAGCDLDDYWKQKQYPFQSKTRSMNPTKMDWLAKQIRGLVSGIDNIHNPPHLKSLSPEAKAYARHGDIKPQNILWFRSDISEEGTLAIGDLGIANIHRLASRSNVPNHDLPCSPDYRPPECDQLGGVISRAYDIWTLGCLLLEMTCWALGGYSLVKEFERQRSLVPYIGVMSPLFFDVKKADNGSATILVKDVVVKMMSRLHGHEGCTPYFHELLNLIHGHMLVVLSKTSERMRSGMVLENIESMHKRMEDPKYGLTPKPETHQYEEPVGVETRLNDFGSRRFEKFNSKLERFVGRVEKAKTEIEMKQVDQS